MEALALVAKASSRHSLFKGVTLYKPTSKWRAQISHGGRTVTLGDYGTEEEAARVFDRACICKYGKDAACNFPLEDYKAEWDFLQATTIPALLLKFKEERQRSKGLRTGRAAQVPSASGSPVLENARTLPKQNRSQARQQGDTVRSAMPSPASGLQSRDAAEAGMLSAAGSSEAIVVKLERPSEQVGPAGRSPDLEGRGRPWGLQPDATAALQHLLPAYADTRASPAHAAVLWRSLGLADNTNPGLPFSRASSSTLPEHLEPHKLGPWLQHASRAVPEQPSDVPASDESEQACIRAPADEAAMPSSKMHVARQRAGGPRAGSDGDSRQRISDGSSAGPSSRATVPGVEETAQRCIEALDARPTQAPTSAVPWPAPMGAAAASHAVLVRNGGCITAPEYLSEASPHLASAEALLGLLVPSQLPSRLPAPKRCAAHQTTDRRCVDDAAELSGMDPGHDFAAPSLDVEPDKAMDLDLAMRMVGAASGAGAPYHPGLRASSLRPPPDWPQPPNKRIRVMNPDSDDQPDSLGRLQERVMEEQELPPHPRGLAAVAVSTRHAPSATAATHRAAAIIAASATLQKGAAPSFPAAALRQIEVANTDAAHAREQAPHKPCGALAPNTAAPSQLAPAASGGVVHDGLDRDHAMAVLRHLLLAALLRREEEQQQLRLRQQQQQQQDFLIRQVAEALGLRPLGGGGALEVLAALHAQDGAGTGTVKQPAGAGCRAAAAGAADLWSQDAGLNRSSNSSNNGDRGLQVATDDAGADRQLGLGSAQDKFNQRPQLRASGGGAAPPRHASTRPPSSSSQGSPGLSSSSAGGDAAANAVAAATVEGHNAAAAASTYEYTQTQRVAASGAAATAAAAAAGRQHLPLHLAAVHLAPLQPSIAGSGAAGGREFLFATKLLVPAGNGAAAAAAAAAGGQHVRPLLHLEAPASTAAAALAGAPVLRLALGGNGGTVPTVVAARRDRNPGVANMLDMPVVLRVPVQLNQPQVLSVLQLEEGQHPARPALGGFGGDGGPPLRRIQIVSDA